MAGYPPDPQPQDTIARIVASWEHERPELDASPMLVVGRIARLNHVFDRALRAPFAAVGLANGDFDVLAALRRIGQPYAARPVELSRHLMVTTGGITKRLDRLEGLGLVAREGAVDDGRGKLAILTRAGIELVDQLIAEHVANEGRLLAALDADQRDQLQALLGLLAGALEETEPEPWAVPGARSRG